MTRRTTLEMAKKSRAATIAAQTPPADIYGRPFGDRFLRGLTAFNEFYLKHWVRAKDVSIPEVPTWSELVVRERRPVCDGAISLRLSAPGGAPLPPWQAGAHLRVQLPSGLIRHYSLCGDPRDRFSYRIAVRRIENGGGGSTEIHDTLDEGSTILAMEPRNAFPFAGEPSVLFLVGGIGITPVMPMIRDAVKRRLDWSLVYAGRSRAALPFLDDIAKFDDGAARAAKRVRVIADDENGGTRDWAAIVREAPKNAAIYCCGPAPMLDAVRSALDAVDAPDPDDTDPAAASRPARPFHFERFTPPPITDGHAFELELNDGTVLNVPADRSALDVLRDHDTATPYSCRQGFCGVCRLHVKSGGIDHRDGRLTDQERADGDMLVCVSRAPEGERLVIDR